jgi:predicted O-methyltransferase YrrM
MARIEAFQLPLAVRRIPQRIRNYGNLRREFRAMREQYSHCASLEEQVALICAHQVFRAIQQQGEIIGLLRLLEKDPPRYVCEIGTASGGTLFLLTKVCRPDALLISVDLGLELERSLVHSRFATGKQRVVSIRRDSRDVETIRQVRSSLRGKLLDLLFIDGDHGYEAVKADFTDYAPLVRPGGLVVFHDIARDFHTRYGKPTSRYTGGVPTFWEETKRLHRTTELIEDPEQDGFGIGIIHT